MSQWALASRKTFLQHSWIQRQWQWNTRQQVHSNWLINKQWHEAQPTQRKYQQLARELHCLAKANVHTTYNDRWIPWTLKDIHIFHLYKSRHCDKEVDKLRCTHNTHQFQMINNTKLHTTTNNSTKWEIDEKQNKKNLTNFWITCLKHLLHCAKYPASYFIN